MFLNNLKRLFVAADINKNQSLTLSKEQTHYLINVMRLSNGDNIKIFNAKDGEWLAVITIIKKNQVMLEPLEKLREQEKLKDIWLLFAPLKKNETDFVLQKATELGVTKITPVITKRTNASRVNLERLNANAIEASEQCERLCIPEITKEYHLENILKDFPSNTCLYFLDERGIKNGASNVFSKNELPKAAFLIGPEGGFDEAEKELLLQYNFVTPITLGKRILRAETACLAVLALWQAIKGDWI